MEPNKKKDKANRQINKAIGQYSMMSVSISMCVIVGFLFGNFLDKKFSTQPIFLIIFLIMGIIASYRTLFKSIKNDKDNSK